MEWTCNKHGKCLPETEEWRMAMAEVLGFNYEGDKYEEPEDQEDLDVNLDEQQLCPLCVLDLQEKADKSPKKSTEIQLKAARKRIQDLEVQRDENSAAVGAVCEFIKEATGTDPRSVPVQASPAFSAYVGQPVQGGLSTIIANLMHEAVLKRVQERLAKRDNGKLTKVVEVYPGDDCPWMEFKDQDGKELFRVEYDDQVNEVTDKALEAVCKAAGIEFEKAT